MSTPLAVRAPVRPTIRGRNACAELSNTTSQTPIASSTASSAQTPSHPPPAPAAISANRAVRTTFAPIINR